MYHQTLQILEQQYVDTIGITGHILYLIVLLLCIKENVSIGKVKLESILDVAIISHAVNGNSMQDVRLKNAILPYYIFQGR